MIAFSATHPGPLRQQASERHRALRIRLTRATAGLGEAKGAASALEQAANPPLGRPAEKPAAVPGAILEPLLATIDALLVSDPTEDRRTVVRQIVLVLLDAWYGHDLAAEALDTIPEAVTDARRWLVPLIAEKAMAIAPDPETVRAVLELVPAERVSRWKRADLIRLVAEVCGIEVRDMLSARRSRKVVRPRQIAAFLCKIYTPSSYPEIGRSLGGRDHTTALHAVQKVERIVAASGFDVDVPPKKLAERLAELTDEGWIPGREPPRVRAS